MLRPDPIQPGKRILSARSIRVSPKRVSIGTSQHGCSNEPMRIETREVDGVVREIIVTCHCGQKTVIDCDYTTPEATSTDGTSPNDPTGQPGRERP